MYGIASTTCLATFASFGWGVLYFFEKPAGVSVRAVMVAVFGLFFGLWDAHAVWVAGSAPWLVVAGVAVNLMSAAIFWSAVRACGPRHLSAIFETDAPTFLVQRGPYQVVRHPFYASYTLFWIAGWIASGSYVALLGVAIMVGYYLQGMREEELKFARSPLAAEYAAYRRRVGALVPNWRRRH
jgi:protein-S-isoprenylcysteine O-methyltransferase Ste14